MKSFYNTKKLILILGDIVVLYLSLYLALMLRYQQLPSSRLLQDHFWPFSIIFVFCLLILYISNLYDLRLAVNNARFWQLAIKSLAASVAFSFTFFYLIPNIGIAPKTNLIIFVLIFLILFSFWRQFYNWSLKAYLPKNNIAIIGINDQTKELIKELNENSHLGYNITFIVDDQNQTQNSFSDSLKIINNFSDLPDIVKNSRIDTIVFTGNLHESNDLRSALFACLPLKINFVNLPIFYEAITGRVPISVINQTWFLENLSEGARGTFDLYKRMYDLLFSIILLMLTIIFWPFIAIVIKIESRGPAFFLQTRVGKNGQLFKMIKFRTMKEEGNNRDLTTKNDGRVTRFGSFLRKSRIDELPQLINIIKGEMSFVGPRPERPEFVQELSQIVPFYRERMLVKPGVTGWDQISGEYHSPTREDTLKKLQSDLFYIKNRSIYLDLSIILKTIYTVLSHGGR